MTNQVSTQAGSGASGAGQGARSAVGESASGSRVRKNFILDTNVLLHDPRALFAFGDNNVIVPIYVIEEVDNFKRDLTELGRNARQVSRYLDQLREQGPLADGVPLENGGTLRVAFTDRTIPAEFANSHQMDNRILSVALDTRDQDPQTPTIFVTMDSNLRIRADALGVSAVNFETEPVGQISELYSGMQEITVEAGAIDRFYREGVIDAPNEGEGMRPNEHATLIDASNPSHTALAKFRDSDRTLVPLIRGPKEGIFGIRPRNREQAFALDVLLNDEISLVTMVGKAGTGKTLLAIAAALHKVMEEGIYHKLLVSRPIFPLGRDIGYLPGDVEEKLNPWMQPIYDNVEFLMGLSRADKKAGRSYQELVDLGIMSIEPLTYIRGRSIPQQFIIVDEAQNLTPHEVKTIITRAGDDTKIVLTGDPYQIDNPYVDSTSNGLVHVVHRFLDERIAGHVTLTKGERSKLAELAANLL